ncbi:MAG: type transport system permease protein [Pseudonocardiales bacterium]|jgi:hypothetical protein|nr:type transport system permease protein [Pseudonocardiales bacterium]
MTASVTATARPGELDPYRVTQVGVIRSEWIKLRSLRSTWFSLLAALLIIDGLGTLFSALHTHRMEQGVGPNGRIFGIDATQISLRGVFLAQLAIGVLGVLVITGEYSTGMIRSSLAAVPHRTPVLIAKALVFAVIVFVTSLIATLFGIVLVAPILANALPTPYSTDVAKYLPLNTGSQVITTVNPDPNLFGPWAGIGITALYALAALVAGALMLNRRDA